MKLKITILATIICFMSLSSQAQRYKSSIGLRLTFPLEVAFKTFLTEDKAIEVAVGYGKFLGIKSKVFRAAGFHHINVDKNVKNLDVFVGAGLGLYVSKAESLFGVFDIEDITFYEVGITGYAGGEYKFEDQPFAISLDATPTYIIGSSSISGIRLFYTSLTLRYTF